MDEMTAVGLGIGAALAAKSGDPWISKLIETVAGFVDAWTEPHRIRRKADAEADAEITAANSKRVSDVIATNTEAEMNVVRAGGKVLSERTEVLGDIETQRLALRGQERLAKRIARQQRNIETVTANAASELLLIPKDEAVTPEAIDEDWIHRFFQECQDVSNREMLLLWGKLSAGEIKHPGSFSPRTLSVVKDMTKADAELFTALCSGVWHIHDKPILIFDREAWSAASIPAERDVLLHLESLGLVRDLGLFGYSYDVSESCVSYFGRSHRIEHPTGASVEFDVGSTLLTAAGAELVEIAHPLPSEIYRSHMITLWNRQWRIDGKDPTGS